MELFKNKVGRPSNEIIKKRKVFVISLMIFILIIFTLVFMLIKQRTNNLKGSAKNGLELSCPTNVSYGKVFQCKTNSSKATVRVSQGGLSEHYLDIFKKNGGKVVTTKKVVNLMYDKGGIAKVIAEQDGFEPVTRYININKETDIKNIKLHDTYITFTVVPGWYKGEKDVITSASIYKCSNNYCKVNGKLKTADYYGRIKMGIKEISWDRKNRKDTQVYNLSIYHKEQRAGLFFISVKVNNNKRPKNEKVVNTAAFEKAYTATKKAGLMYSPTENVVSYGGADSRNGGFPHDASLSCGTQIFSPVYGKITYEVITKNGRVASYGAVATIRFSGFGSNKDYGYIKFAHLEYFTEIKLDSSERKSTYPSSCGNGGCSSKVLLTRVVQRGEYIGDVGTSGNSSGCHLHTEVWINGSRRNPNTYFSY